MTGEGDNKRIRRIAPNPDDVGDNWPTEIALANGPLHDESNADIMTWDLRCRNLRIIRDPKFNARIYELLHQKPVRKAMCEAHIQWDDELIDRWSDEGLEGGRRS